MVLAADVDVQMSRVPCRIGPLDQTSLISCITDIGTCEYDERSTCVVEGIEARNEKRETRADSHEQRVRVHLYIN